MTIYLKNKNLIRPPVRKDSDLMGNYDGSSIVSVVVEVCDVENSDDDSGIVHRKVHSLNCVKTRQTTTTTTTTTRTKTDLLILWSIIMILIVLVTTINCHQINQSFIHSSDNNSIQIIDNINNNKNSLLNAFMIHRNDTKSNLSNNSDSNFDFVSEFESDTKSKFDFVSSESRKIAAQNVSRRLPTNFDGSMIDGRGKNSKADKSAAADQRRNGRDIEKLQQMVMHGLGLQKLPDVSKMNISQEEYIKKYNEYFQRVNERRYREHKLIYSDLNENRNTIDIDSGIKNNYLRDLRHPIKLFTYSYNVSNDMKYALKRRTRRSLNKNDSVFLRFSINFDDDFPSEIEEGTLRVLIVGKKKIQNDNFPFPINTNEGNSSEQSNTEYTVNLKVYQVINQSGHECLDSRMVKFSVDELNTAMIRWVDFDVSDAIDGWLSGSQPNLGLEIRCDTCHHYGLQILDEGAAGADPQYGPILNVVGRIGTQRRKRSRQQGRIMQQSPKRKPRKTDCYKENQKCCRHTMEVVFKEIKGFEFIIQPKVFDAGYCRGKCPPRYNPAHHHALLQSLIWKQDRRKAPRPCCAPSKLVELEVLHVDEKDSRKLKVSTWTDMKVLECACS